MKLILVAIALAAPVWCAGFHRTLVLTGEKSEHRWKLSDIDPAMPSDWTGYSHLVLEFRHSSPQRFYLFAYDKGGPRRVVIQPYGQNVWIRAAVPLRYFERRDIGNQMAQVNNRGTPSFWMSVWGPFGTISAVEAIGITMEYPLRKPTLEIRSIQLAKEDPGSAILDNLPVVDEFGQWIHGDWPRKIKSLDQLKREWAAEDRALEKAPDFGYARYGGYRGTQRKATGYFRTEKADGKWWFVDPDGHLFLALNVFGMSLGFPGAKRDRESYYKQLPDSGLLQSSFIFSTPGNTVPMYSWNLQRRYGEKWRQGSVATELKRMSAWGLNVGAGLEFIAFGGVENWKPSKPYTAILRPPLDNATTFLGVPDIYGDGFADRLDAAIAASCRQRAGDPLLLGYFVGNEPPWPERESEVVDMILKGPATGTQRRLREYLAGGDTGDRRRAFVREAFDKYLEWFSAAVRKHDPHHLNIGMRFGGQPPDYLLKMARHFDVLSLNPYEYSPVEHLDRASKLIDKPILFGEFQFGVPENGLGGSLVQTASQTEKGIAYRYYLEQAASHPSFVGASWFTGVDQPALSSTENYNIGFIDVTDRPYPELVKAAITAHRNLRMVHEGRKRPFHRLPKASEAGTPKHRLSDAF